ncbi:hypothetical protein FGO68_gene8316 [Halteria grandinella]|uniref:Uncharacterized protein n=1 Tax=Halteria grandinella TaxID=5974 RepID=A0A8J8P3T9_HALGN|nr:hypothetical protein FGO68_gene8316 [Halteria grandinella]
MHQLSLQSQIFVDFKGPRFALVSLKFHFNFAFDFYHVLKLQLWVVSCCLKALCYFSSLLKLLWTLVIALQPQKFLTIFTVQSSWLERFCLLLILSLFSLESYCCTGEVVFGRQLCSFTVLHFAETIHLSPFLPKHPKCCNAQSSCCYPPFSSQSPLYSMVDPLLNNMSHWRNQAFHQ